MISTTLQRYILLIITTLCVFSCVYIAIVIYNNFYLPIFNEARTIQNEPVETFPTPTVSAVLKALADRQQQTVDLSTVHNPFTTPTNSTSQSIPDSTTEPIPQ